MNTTTANTTAQMSFADFLAAVTGQAPIPAQNQTPASLPAAPATELEAPATVKEQIAAITADLRKIAGLNIEILGSWIWVTGKKQTAAKLAFIQSQTQITTKNFMV